MNNSLHLTQLNIAIDSELQMYYEKLYKFPQDERWQKAINCIINGLKEAKLWIS